MVTCFLHLHFSIVLANVSTALVTPSPLTTSLMGGAPKDIFSPQYFGTVYNPDINGCQNHHSYILDNPHQVHSDELIQPVGERLKRCQLAGIDHGGHLLGDLQWSPS